MPEMPEKELELLLVSVGICAFAVWAMIPKSGAVCIKLMVALEEMSGAELDCIPAWCLLGVGGGLVV